MGQKRVSADQFDQQIAALQTQVSSLNQQIATLQQQSASATAQAVAAQQSLAATQTKLSTARTQLDVVNQELAATTANLQSTEAQLAYDRGKLSRLLVNMYELDSSGSVATALVDSKSFVDAIDTLTSISQVSDSVRRLVDDVHTQEQQLTALRAAQQAQQQQAAGLVTTLQTLAAQQAGEQQQFEQQAGALSGQAAALVQQLHGVEGQIAQVRAEQAAAREANVGAVRVLGGALPPFAYGPRLDGFPWGQCTWYAASLHDVSWNGDAWEWAYSARAAGASEGMAPRTGSLVVFAPGGLYSGFGHVAYVVAVHGPSSFTVDEGNYLGLGIIDQRNIYSLSGVEAFIY